MTIPNAKCTRTHAYRGVTLLEILIAVAIMGFMSAFILAAFSEFRARKTMDASVELALAAFSRAHLDTLSSKNDMRYGVHVESGKVVYFAGLTYASGAEGNVPYTLSSAIEIANISLQGGGSDVLYNRLNGGTDQYGSFDIRVKARPTVKTTITITATGGASIQ